MTARCASLPSSDSAQALVRGEPGALVGVLVTTALRAGLVAAGAYAAGVRGTALKRAAIGGALAIEVFVLAWVAHGEASGTG